MNPRRLIHSLAFRFSQASRFSVCNSLGLLCIFFQLGCDFYPPPFPVSRAIILELHAANPYDQNYVDLQQQLLTLSRAGQRDEIFRVLTPRLFEASVVFHILLEKSLLWHYLAQSDSARLHAQAALNIAEFMAQVRADSFFVKRHRLLQRLMQTDASQVEHWLIANAVFIRALTLDTKDLERKQQCFNFARKQFHDLGDDK